jgi:Uma2 family endonuclease
MAEADVFRPKQPIELLDGEVMKMSPIGSRHAACVDWLTQELVLGLNRRAIVRTQGPIQVGEYSEPEPDVAVLALRAALR